MHDALAEPACPDMLQVTISAGCELDGVVCSTFHTRLPHCWQPKPVLPVWIFSSHLEVRCLALKQCCVPHTFWLRSHSARNGAVRVHTQRHLEGQAVQQQRVWCHQPDVRPLIDCMPSLSGWHTGKQRCRSLQQKRGALRDQSRWDGRVRL